MTIQRMVMSAAMVFAVLWCVAPSEAAEPKRLLVVTTTTGFRHDIAVVEKGLDEIAKQTHAFTLDYLRQPPGQPVAPKKPKALKDGASAEEKAAFDAATEKYNAEDVAYQLAMVSWNETLKVALRKLGPESLANYDGVIFASTTGDLPIPDKQGFLDWIKAGHAFIGIHSASDTFPDWPDFIDMVGGHFLKHGPQVGVEIQNLDPKHPSTRHLPAVFKIDLEEIYQFEKYDASRVRELLVLDKHPNDKTPGHFPLAWCKDYGSGRVFYTALGHREDMWNANPALKDRKNPVETTKAFQEHVLGGILWAIHAESELPKVQTR